MIFFALFFLTNVIIAPTSLVVERYNYASFDCAARVLATSPDTKSAWAILQALNRDAYLKFLCAAPSKYVIVELCADIRLDTIVLANTEYFSSVFKEFRVWGGKKFPVDADWLDLGTFTAENTRLEQHFVIRKATTGGYIRFLKIEFLSHYGSEYICPVSLLKAFGKTMMEDFVDEKRLVDENAADLVPKVPEEVDATLLFEQRARVEECKVREENVFKAINERLNAFEQQIALLARERTRVHSMKHSGPICVQTAHQPLNSTSPLVYISFALSCLALILIISLFSRLQQITLLPKKERTALMPSTPGGVILEDDCSRPDATPHNNMNSPTPLTPSVAAIKRTSNHKNHKNS